MDAGIGVAFRDRRDATVVEERVGIILMRKRDALERWQCMWVIQ